MHLYKNIELFIGRLRTRLNLGVHLRSLSYGLLASTAVMMIVALLFVWMGQRVDLRYTAIAVAVGAVVYSVFLFMLRISSRDAARYADEKFKMKDGISSAISFRKNGKEGGIYDLQLDDTSSKVSELDHRAVPLKPDWPSLRISTVCLIAIIVLSLFPETASVRAERLMREESLVKTEEIKEFLEKELKEAEKELTDEEKEILKKSKMAELIKNLEKTDDRKEALRKFAEIEKEIRETASSNSTEEDERVLKAMASELKKGKASPELSKSLADGNYEKAAEALKKMVPKEKKGDKNFNKQCASMKSAANRMKNAADNSKASKNKFCKNASELSKLSKEMSKALSEAKEMDENSSKNCKNGSCKMGECKTCETGKKMKACAAKMGDNLKDLKARKAVLGMLSKMRKNMGACQSYMLSQGQQSGLMAGKGSEWKKNEEKPENSDKGYFSEVAPQKGKGPTAVSIEEASSGSGVRRLTSSEKSVEFKYQVESFMRREDVNESLKNGVKTYFEIIHEE